METKKQKSVVIRVRPDTRKRLKVNAAKAGTSLIDHLEKLSK